MGAVTANWSNVPPVLRDRPWPALKYTGETIQKSCRPIGLCPIIGRLKPQESHPQRH